MTAPEEKDSVDVGGVAAKLDVEGGGGAVGLAGPDFGPVIEGVAVRQSSALGWVVYAAQPSVATLLEVSGRRGTFVPPQLQSVKVLATSTTKMTVWKRSGLSVKRACSSRSEIARYHVCTSRRAPAAWDVRYAG